MRFIGTLILGAMLLAVGVFAYDRTVLARDPGARTMVNWEVVDMRRDELARYVQAQWRKLVDRSA